MRAFVAVLLIAAAVGTVSASEWKRAGDKCKTEAECGGVLAGLRCNLLTKKCERICAKSGTTCKADTECCSGACRDGVCLCYSHGATCTWGDECCDGSCSSTRGCCRPAGTACDVGGHCCSGICRVLPAPKASLLEVSAEPAKKAEDCAVDTTKPAAAKPAAAAGAAAAKPAAADAKAAAKPAAKDAKAKDAKKPAKKAAPKKAEKMAPPQKQCCADFGQKCTADEPCCPPYLCSEMLGMCTVAVKID